LYLRAVALLVAVAATASANHQPQTSSSDYQYDAPVPGTYQLPTVTPAADGALLDTDRKALRLGELTHGRITVLSFIYTRCSAAKACPYATGVLMDLYVLSAKDPELAKVLRLVSMSFDPAHDTPERMRVYSDLAQGRPQAAPWHFVTAASSAELQPMLAAYGQAVDRKADPADPAGPLNHTLRVYLIDGEGRIRNIYSSGTLDLRLVVADIRTLMLEGAAR